VYREAHGKEPLIRSDLLRNRQLSGGLTMFFFQFLVQAGVFFVVPLYLSVCLGLSALETGARILPLSVTLLAAAILIPKLWPDANPRRVVRIGLLGLLAGTLVLLGGLDPDAGAEIVLVPLLLIGFGIGCLASQLGSVTVSAVPDDQAPEVGGVQNTATNLGASIGTALAGSIMLAAVATAFATNVQANQQVPDRVKEQASTKLGGGVPFISDADFEKAMDDAGVSRRVTDEVLTDYQHARIDGLEAALAVLAIMALLALFGSGRIPRTQPGRGPPAAA
jgi:Na+/melibiose symporter-like transporter